MPGASVTAHPVIATAPDLVTQYTAAGIAVFPVHSIYNGACTCGWSLCHSPGKHPVLLAAHPKDDPLRLTCRGECGQLGHGLHDATTDAGTLAEWLARYPWANWAGRPPVGVIVVDEDPQNGGDTTIAAWAAEGQHIPATLTARSGGGGRHFWLSYNGPTVGKLGKGVDVKTNTGYLVLPPSRHHSGGSYQWLDMSPAAPAPDWVRSLLNPPRYVRPQVKGFRSSVEITSSAYGLVAKVAATPYGEINDVVYWAACRLFEDGVLDLYLEQLVEAARHAAGAMASPAGENQTRRTINSARTAPPRRARSPQKGLLA